MHLSTAHKFRWSKATIILCHTYILIFVTLLTVLPTYFQAHFLSQHTILKVMNHKHIKWSSFKKDNLSASKHQKIVWKCFLLLGSILHLQAVWLPFLLMLFPFLNKNWTFSLHIKPKLSFFHIIITHHVNELSNQTILQTVLTINVFSPETTKATATTTPQTTSNGQATKHSMDG